MTHFLETKYGFEFGAADISRACSDDKRGWVMLVLKTPRCKINGGMQIYVTRTGKVRIFHGGEWKLPAKRKARRER